jgi:hypothetical protein
LPDAVIVPIVTYVRDEVMRPYADEVVVQKLGKRTRFLELNDIESGRDKVR